MSEYFINLTPYQGDQTINSKQIYTFHIQNKYEKSLNRWHELSTWLPNEIESYNLLLFDVASQFGDETTSIMLSNSRRVTRLPLLINSLHFID
jgi:hypothetical protein